MSLTVQIEQQLHAMAGAYTNGTAEAIALLEIPGIDSWHKVKAWRVQWDTFHYALHAAPDEWLKIRLDSEVREVVEWKWPVIIQVLEVDEDGDQTGEVLDEQ